MITATAPGKLVLLGEYAVLRGATALVVAVDRIARVSLASRAHSGIAVTAPQLGLEGVVIDASGDKSTSPGVSAGDQKKLRVVMAVIDEVLKFGPLPTLNIDIDTADFHIGREKLGLGSSAAVAVALCGALFKAQGGQHLNAPEVFNHALNAHRAAQGGAGSGVDIAASVYGGTLRYRMHTIPEPARLPGNVHFLAVWTGKSASTADLVGRVLGAAKDSANVSLILDQLGDCAERGVQAAHANDADAFLSCVAEYHRGYVSLGDETLAPLITSEHAHIEEIASNNDAVYKPSGAGGGDLGVVFCAALELRSRNKRLLTEAGFKTVPLEVHKGSLAVDGEL